jgi:hypothetical protein
MALKGGVERSNGPYFVVCAVEQQSAGRRVSDRDQVLDLGRVSHGDWRADGGQRVKPRVSYMERLKCDG